MEVIPPRTPLYRSNECIICYSGVDYVVKHFTVTLFFYCSRLSLIAGNIEL